MIAVAASQIGKLYQLGSTSRLLSQRILERLRGQRSPSQEYWALRGVSFQIKAGEAVAIIGPNGGGKSTLLKILSRITRPTEGQATVSGRPCALLEVGTGFHGELTGRENVFLNASILGMGQREVAKRFDSIVDFAGIEDFIDTPVKRYSSGMYLRLAFAVAAHLESETLFVDEVLAVGDAAFQRKCLDKMAEIVRGGRTVLFVSHSMHAVKTLCQRSLFLNEGKLVFDGPADEAIFRYLKSGREAAPNGVIPPNAYRPVSSGEAYLRRAVVHSRAPEAGPLLLRGEPLEVSAFFEVFRAIHDAVVEIGISTLDGQRIATVTSFNENQGRLTLPAGSTRLRATIDLALIEGRYAVDIFLHHVDTGVTIDWIERAVEFAVSDLTAPPVGEHCVLLSPERGFPRRGFVRARARFHEPQPGFES